MTSQHTFYAAAILIGALVPFAALGQVKPNCEDPRTQTEMTQCAALDYKAADGQLNAAYRKAVRSMKQTDADLPPVLKGGEKALRAAQRAWIPYRDKACKSYGFLARGGTMESMLVANCLANLTRKRTKELEDLATGLGN